ncbi:hypothetical protein V5J35_001087 [Endozoicomonas sp. NE40]|uniref:Uncharacterized protein n=1 Tax=Endozoicomonas lisbonensis TaxID=3120522 RepID=A0ABV2SDQ8_9GAMM
MNDVCERQKNVLFFRLNLKSLPLIRHYKLTLSINFRYGFQKNNQFVLNGDSVCVVSINYHARKMNDKYKT